jgi:hypothetical protein
MPGAVIVNGNLGALAIPAQATDSLQFVVAKRDRGARMARRRCRGCSGY